MEKENDSDCERLKVQKTSKKNRYSGEEIKCEYEDNSSKIHKLDSLLHRTAISNNHIKNEFEEDEDSSDPLKPPSQLKGASRRKVRAQYLSRALPRTIFNW